ncbi:MAG: ABC transporter substrate-binding protein [Hyphomicrobiales bacterium]|nr:ABC transporter substrate-binding protein [Hyphomicrobiales bacterium]MDE2018151.1 ABC transporter substrate-binding protein [Hyphomicrobiales bacterium]
MTKTIRAALAALALSAAAPAHALDRVSFQTNWFAEAEHGGFYEAVADGTYARYGLDVEIRQGGPNVNGALLLVGGKVDFAMGLDLIDGFNAAASGAPLVVVAAEFQRDPQILMSHPGVGLDRWADLPKAKLFIGPLGRATYLKWLIKTAGFKEENARAYDFSVAPFLADPTSIVQGFVTSEPFAVKAKGGFAPNVFLLADHGFGDYSTTIETSATAAKDRADLVRRFVEASAIGWKHYLHGDRAKADAAILAANPRMTQAQIDYSVAAMKANGIVESGDALATGIGAMTWARIGAFHAQMVAAGVVKDAPDWRKAFDLRFVGKAPKP